MITEINNNTLILRDTSFNLDSHLDLKNIAKQLYALKNKNISIAENDTSKIHVIKNTVVLESTEWKDVGIMERFNKLTIFNDDVAHYHHMLPSITNYSDFITILGKPSESIIKDILKSVYLFDGLNGISDLRCAVINPMTQLTNEEAFEKIKLIYNLLLYSFPAFLLQLSLSTDPDMSIVATAPYEHTCIYIKDLCDLPFENISSILRLQARIENNLPDVGYFKNLYLGLIASRHKIILYSRYWIRAIGMHALIVGPPIILGNLVNNNAALVGTVNHGPPLPDIPLVTGTSSSSEEARRLIEMWVLNV